MRHRKIQPIVINERFEQEQEETVKTRILVNVDTPSSPSFKEKDIMTKLKKCRLDRERMSVLNEAIKSTLPGLESELLEKVKYHYSLFLVLCTHIYFIRLLNIWKYLITMIQNTSFYHNYLKENTTKTQNH